MSGHRYYDPSAGRYVQSDPIGLGGGLSTYSYVGGDSLQQNDPLGLQQNFSIPGQTVDLNTAALLGEYEYAKQGNPFAPEAGTLPDPNIDRNFRQAVGLYASFAVGIMGGELLEAGLACHRVAAVAGELPSSSLQGYRLNQQLSAEMVAGARAPTSIEEWADHVLKQIAGRDGGIGVQKSALEDAFANPQGIRYAPSKYGPTFRYIGQDATVVVNSEGKAVTGWANNSAGTGP